MSNTANQVERYAYINTRSMAGSPTKVQFSSSQVIWIRSWVNHYGNPSYTILLDNGDLLYLVDDYGGTNDLGHAPIYFMKKKKDLFLGTGF